MTDDCLVHLASTLDKPDAANIFSRTFFWKITRPMARSLTVGEIEDLGAYLNRTSRSSSRDGNGIDGRCLCEVLEYEQYE